MPRKQTKAPKKSVKAPHLPVVNDKRREESSNQEDAGDKRRSMRTNS